MIPRLPDSIKLVGYIWDCIIIYKCFIPLLLSCKSYKVTSWHAQHIELLRSLFLYHILLFFPHLPPPISLPLSSCPSPPPIFSPFSTSFPSLHLSYCFFFLLLTAFFLLFLIILYYRTLKLYRTPRTCLCLDFCTTTLGISLEALCAMLLLISFSLGRCVGRIDDKELGRKESISQSVRPSVCLFYLSVPLFMRSVCMSVCLSVSLSVCIYISPTSSLHLFSIQLSHFALSLICSLFFHTNLFSHFILLHKFIFFFTFKLLQVNEVVKYVGYNKTQTYQSTVDENMGWVNSSLLTVCLSVRLSVYLCFCLSITPSIYVSDCVSVCLSVWLVAHLSVGPSVCLSVSLCRCLFVFVCQSVSLYASLSIFLFICLICCEGLLPLSL